ncbi:MAG: OmpA family protein [Treponemataceae bacterium]
MRTMLRRTVLGFLTLCVSLAWAEKFEFLFQNGEKYRINSIVNEYVYRNMQFSHIAEITNRITVEISDTKTEPEKSALFTCNFMTSEKNSKMAGFAWSKQYPSIFRRDYLGRYQISSQYFMPVVRDLPIFPDYDLQPGDTWTGQGHEAHDFQDNFGINEPFIVPFDVNYKYVGETKKDGKKLHLIIAEYEITYNLPEELILQSKKQATVFPITTLGTSRQNLYWDSELGNLTYYDEHFSIRLILNTGDVYDFVGSAKAKVTDLENFDRKKTLKDVQKKLDELGLKDVVAKETEEGITITIENIQFASDSAVLLKSEKQKLDRIGEILKAYPERDLLISGHTAYAGTKEGRMSLSIERANAVAKYLIDKKVREDHHVFTQGFGAEQPIAPNDSEENMSKNRRVEITIIDK